MISSNRSVNDKLNDLIRVLNQNLDTADKGLYRITCPRPRWGLQIQNLKLSSLLFINLVSHFTSDNSRFSETSDRILTDRDVVESPRTDKSKNTAKVNPITVEDLENQKTSTGDG